ncbi:uncharacterized protein LOC122929100 isoform X6 [Bufo gargarizans]|uniref:uncharacterized protein LOC122929100 isoform X6 n=1 Tax=Bufo gargarizans TaxID=30331 RepID=UPI001CF5CF58|nr:uncharacterized protein LOC122929100 isoform X6 [Bufo gargarizans]
MYLIVTILLLKLNQEESTSHSHSAAPEARKISSRWCTRRMALDCNEMNGQEGSSRSTEESEGVYEQGRIQEGREEIEETPDPTHKQVTPHTREDQSEDQPSSGISRVKESVQQICLISYTILQLLYIYMLEDPDVVELLLQLLTQLWRFIKWSFVIVTDILERTVLYHVDHIRLSPSLSRFAKKIFCQQKSYRSLNMQWYVHPRRSILPPSRRLPTLSSHLNVKYSEQFTFIKFFHKYLTRCSATPHHPHNGY